MHIAWKGFGRRWWLVPLVGLFACGSYSRTDVLTGTPGDRPGECLDLRVEAHEDPYTVARGWPAVRYAFGNPCRGATDLHLGRAEVWWHDAFGRAARLHAFDPRDELHAGLLDGGQHADEVIAYTAAPLTGAPTGDLASLGSGTGGVPAGRVCVHVTQIAADAAAMAPHCFEWRGAYR